ncbi:MAG: AbrB/MazE/SpoVT family DNA-binding domain-containing protein [Candidatus Omnitrophica bacterium]|nr:AbrB/MazE/SpoVT family DNA-binding domain-containing protein [Candidatus Omnitrophota bacterium]
MMFVKVSSKNQVTIPKAIAVVFSLKKGDLLEIEREKNRIVMIPKEVFLEDKYPKEDLEAAEKVLSKGLPKEEIAFQSGEEMIRHFKKRVRP